MTNIKRRITN